MKRLSDQVSTSSGKMTRLHSCSPVQIRTEFLDSSDEDLSFDHDYTYTKPRHIAREMGMALNQLMIAIMTQVRSIF